MGWFQTLVWSNCGCPALWLQVARIPCRSDRPRGSLRFIATWCHCSNAGTVGSGRLQIAYLEPQCRRNHCFVAAFIHFNCYAWCNAMWYKWTLGQRLCSDSVVHNVRQREYKKCRIIHAPSGTISLMDWGWELQLNAVRFKVCWNTSYYPGIFRLQIDILTVDTALILSSRFSCSTDYKIAWKRNRNVKGEPM